MAPYIIGVTVYHGDQAAGIQVVDAAHYDGNAPEVIANLISARGTSTNMWQMFVQIARTVGSYG